MTQDSLFPNKKGEHKMISFLKDSVADIDIDIEREVPQPHFADINKESERPLPGEVPQTEDFPQHDTTDIDTEMKGPPQGKVPPPKADIFVEDEEVPLIFKINKEKREPTR
ncbi:uncharacterized protein A4U43_C04F19410 [Asparagus officinalis]|uniref:Uncharacterized protein n=1 Tax=Asparagus officinalis TaxID=4686 RepID=A0A5P1F250_ASPOF|nr:uncharacterized protein A4U43_C04F19410 [Asparagus officinalis]